MRLASWMSLGIMVTLLAWIAHEGREWGVWQWSSEDSDLRDNWLFD